MIAILSLSQLLLLSFFASLASNFCILIRRKLSAAESCPRDNDFISISTLFYYIVCLFLKQKTARSVQWQKGRYKE